MFQSDKQYTSNNSEAASSIVIGASSGSAMSATYKITEYTWLPARNIMVSALEDHALCVIQAVTENTQGMLEKMDDLFEAKSATRMFVCMIEHDQQRIF